MKKRVANKWRKALNSGDYEQCQHALMTKNEDGTKKYFCCLGVLSMLYIEEHPDGNLVPTFIIGEGFFGDQSSYLPKEVMKWAGMKTSNGKYDINEITGSGRALSSDNDDGRTFGEISIIIDKNVDAL